MLHAHHGAASLTSAVVPLHGSHARVHSRVDAWVPTLARHDRIIGVGLLDNLRLLANHVEHGRLQELLVLGKAILFPGIVQHLWIQVVALHALVKERNAVFIIWILLKFQGAAMFHVLLEFYWVALAELVEASLQLFLLNILVLFILILTWEILPRERSSKEVDDHVTDCFQVISSRLFLTKMGGEGGVSGGSCQILTFYEWDVLSLRILVALSQTEINDVDVVASGVCTDQEVIRFNVSMNYSFLMNLFNSFDHLLCNQATSFKVEFPFALHKEVLKTWPKHIHNHDMELILFIRFIGSDIIELWNVCFSSQFMDKFAFPEEHHVLGVFYRSFDLCSIN